MTAVALAAFDDDDEPRPVPTPPPVDVAELDELYRELYRLLGHAPPATEGCAEMTEPPRRGIRAVLESVVVDGFPRRAFTVREVHCMTGISERTLYRLITEGVLEHKRTGRSVYITTDGLARFFEHDEDREVDR